jgi:hypothetical protein
MTAAIGLSIRAVATRYAPADSIVRWVPHHPFRVLTVIFFRMLAVPMHQVASFVLPDLSVRLVLFLRLHVRPVNSARTAHSPCYAALEATKKCPVNQIHHAPTALLVIGAKNLAYHL